ncbi:hypothetical protein SO694_00006269 [Aureococcus anophagefferens]|uniref:Uncharacterized protein n=1 Tax=Aureococcus anophagefferens TaxID=44056 RepID=A0ABR1GA39_AURAN
MVVAKLFAGYGEAVDMIIFARCAADLGLIFLAWVLVGSLFYKYDTPADPWNDGYAVYYSPKPRPSRDVRRRNTDACGPRSCAPWSTRFSGTCSSSTRSACWTASRPCGPSSGKAAARRGGCAATSVRAPGALSALYGATLVFAGLVARYAARYDKFLDCLLFAVTNSMTCGLLYGQPSSRDWWWTTASVVLSVPAAAAWCSELAHLVFLEYENNEAALYAIASKKAGARREGEELGG